MIDENVLQTKIRTLSAHMQVQVNMIEKARHTLDILNEIRLSDGRLPKDRYTGVEMTEERRQEVHDACIAVADELLGLD